MEPLQELAKKIAASLGLDPALVCAVCEQESGWDIYAIRYEPAFFVKYVMPIAGLSDTEKHARSTSWGLMQVMGQTARELGFTHKFLSSLCDPEFGVHTGCAKLLHCLKISANVVDSALLHYNGGRNAAYPTEVLARMDKYK